jgi:hypothetical protein
MSFVFIKHAGNGCIVSVKQRQCHQLSGMPYADRTVAFNITGERLIHEQFDCSRNGFLVRRHVVGPTRRPGTHSIQLHPCINEAGPLGGYSANATCPSNTTNIALSPTIVQARCVDQIFCRWYDCHACDHAQRPIPFPEVERQWRQCFGLESHGKRTELKHIVYHRDGIRVDASSGDSTRPQMETKLIQMLWRMEQKDAFDWIA